MDEPINLATVRKRALVLDAETILAINAKLARLCEEFSDLEEVHGSFTVEIVKGRFQRLYVSDSTLLHKPERRHRDIA